MQRLSSLIVLASALLALPAFAAKENFNRQKANLVVVGEIPGVEGGFTDVANLGFELIEDAEGNRRPGPARFSDIVLKRGVTSSKAFFEWVMKAANRGASPVDIPVQLVSPSGEVVHTFVIVGAVPLRWYIETDPTQGGLAIECIEIAHEGLK